jgi:hypothetical protein
VFQVHFSLVAYLGKVQSIKPIGFYRVVIFVAQYFWQSRQSFYPLANMVRGVLVGRKALAHLSKPGVSSRHLTNSSTGKNTRCARIFPVS